MKCGYCGKTIRDSAAFCRYCGHSLDGLPSGGEGAPPVKSRYLPALLTLIIILAALAAGGLRLVVPVMPMTLPASPSDLRQTSSASARDYQALVGKWKCTDPAAAGYTASDYGIDVSIVLTVMEDGSCGLRYRLTDTGVKALQLDLSGTFAADQQVVTFRPDLSLLDGQSLGRYFLRHGKELPFAYTVKDDVLTLTDGYGEQTKWTRVSTA